MNYERHCWRLLVLGLIFGFILGGFVTGVCLGNEDLRNYLIGGNI